MNITSTLQSNTQPSRIVTVSRMATPQLSSISSRFLLVAAQTINVASLLLLFAPVTLPFLLGSEFVVEQSTEYAYLHSFGPFIPKLLLNLLFGPETFSVPVVEFENTAGSTFKGVIVLFLRRLRHEVHNENAGNYAAITIFFPAIAIDCALGIIQGFVLGTHMLVHQNGPVKAPWIPALSLFLFGGMCIGAFPLHCLKKVVDIEDGDSRTSNFFFWLDTFCTASASALLLVSFVYENAELLATAWDKVLRTFAPQEHSHNQVNVTANKWTKHVSDRVVLRVVVSLLFAIGFLTAMGVMLRNRWIMVFMHVVVMQYCSVAMLFIILIRCKMNDTVDGLTYIVLSFMTFVTLAVGPLLKASWIIQRFDSVYCPVSAFFVASRICIVQCWAYLNAQPAPGTISPNENKKKVA